VLTRGAASEVALSPAPAPPRVGRLAESPRRRPVRDERRSRRDLAEAACASCLQETARDDLVRATSSSEDDVRPVRTRRLHLYSSARARRDAAGHGGAATVSGWPERPSARSPDTSKFGCSCHGVAPGSRRRRSWRSHQHPGCATPLPPREHPVQAFRLACFFTSWTRADQRRARRRPRDAAKTLARAQIGEAPVVHLPMRPRPTRGPGAAGRGTRSM